MNIRYDSQADALYIKFRERPIEESDEIKEGTIVDFDINGKVIGIEILNASSVFEGIPEIKVELPSAELVGK